MSLPAALATAPTADPVKVAGFPPAVEGTITIAGCFGAFLRRLVPMPAAYGEARAAGTEVAAALRAELYPRTQIDVSGVDHLIAGSVGKRTAIAPIQSVDLLYVLPPRLAAPRAADAVKIIAAVLQDRFTVADADGTGAAVRREDMTVKVWPARQQDGAFLMPSPATLDRASGWSITNPIAEAATLRLSDSLYGGRPRLLLAALKAWRLHGDVPIEPFALELLVLEFYGTAPRAFAIDKALPEFWGWLRSRAGTGVRPPGGRSMVDVGDRWQAKAKGAYWRATLAEHHIKERRLVDAAVEWRQALGPAFPVPGETPLKKLPLFKGVQR
ncbi:MAG: hypothetical protein EPO08_02780 [Rhodospirillaceae bacterium]|nr:MAG: hypothetical protein EPO08_02780 [Rhodospirillaceae bacterium]